MLKQHRNTGNEERGSQNLSELTEAMRKVVPDSSLAFGSGASLRALAERFLFAAEIEAVKELRRERNCVLPFGPGFCHKEEQGGIPIDALGLKKSTEKKCRDLYVVRFEDPKEPLRRTWMDRGIEKAETMTQLTASSLRHVRFNDNEILEIGHCLKKFDLSLLPSSAEGFEKALPATTDMALIEHDNFFMEKRLNFARKFKANLILGEDLALIPGIPAATAALLKKRTVMA